MKGIQLLVFGLLSGVAIATNPLGQVVSLLNDLAAKIKLESAAAEKLAEEYAEWCKTKLTETGFAITTGETSKDELEATIAKLSADAETSSSKIDDLAASIAQAESELKEATGVHEKEVETFKASEAELTESIEVLGRASIILEREMAKKPAALVQVDTTNVANMIKSISAIINAAALPGGDQKKLMALVQSQQNADSDDEDMEAPAAAAYKTHSTSILDVIEDLKEKAEGELSDLRKASVNAMHNFEMLKQSLTDSIEADSKTLADTKSGKGAAIESKATAEGDLTQTIKDLESDIKTKADTETKCAEVAEDHTASMKGRSEELAAITEAKKVISETSAGAVAQTYSFTQVAESYQGGVLLQDHTRLANVEIVNLVKRLAKQHHSAVLSQLASRIATVFRYGEKAGENPFAKVKALISDLITKLEEEASSESSEKAFCDDELAKTAEKKSELDGDIAKLVSKIDTSATKAMKLKEDVKALNVELAELASSQADATKLREAAHANYVKAKADLELGLSGVRQALSVLREYYGSAAFVQQPAAPTTFTAKAGAGTSIVELLEVVESDFAKNLAVEETEESDQAVTYEKTTQENKITTAMKTKDVKYTEAEITGLEKSIAELSSDKDSMSTELQSILEYDASLKKRCMAKPEKYEDRKAAREAEIAGLKQALQILETETAFMQRGKRGLRSTFLAPF